MVYRLIVHIPGFMLFSVKILTQVFILYDIKKIEVLITTIYEYLFTDVFFATFYR